MARSTQDGASLAPGAPEWRMVTILLMAVLLLLGWAYAGYPLAVAFAGRWLLPGPEPRRRAPGRSWLLISAFDEETVIASKLENSLALRGKDLSVVVVSDGSTDRTDAIVLEFARRDPRVRLVRVEGRLGKNHALNEALERLETDPSDVVVFSDANAMYEPDAVEALRAALAAGAGCAVGKLLFIDERTGTARAEGMYWRYENRLKESEGRLGRLLVANGAIFAARVADVPRLPSAVGNDFWIPVSLLGRRVPVTYVSDAVALEAAPDRGTEEFRRKVRMSNRSMSGTLVLWSRLDAATRLQLLSHKVLRWLGLPLYLSAVVLTGVAATGGGAGYASMLALLLAPLPVVGVGVVGRVVGKRVPVADLGVHFLLVHAAAILGVIEALRGKRRPTWERAHSARRVTV